jgi:Tfp pilus assembly protein PilX
VCDSQEVAFARIGGLNTAVGLLEKIEERERIIAEKEQKLRALQEAEDALQEAEDALQEAEDKDD